MEKLGKYRLMKRLAQGGMAEIYLAEQQGPGGFNKELVIKRILPQFAEDDEFITMFLDEARLAAQLSHPKIAQIYELGELEGSYFIAMEFIDGIDLAEVIRLTNKRGENVPVDIAAKFVIDVLEALDYAHDFTNRDGEPYGLVHRDVSPHNVLVSNDGIVKLVDFGVAKAAANQAKTQTGAVKGKFAYMAPEQIQKKKLDRRADIFAAGILFYELLTARKPFGEDLEAVSNILNMPPPDPRDVRSDVPAEVVNIIHRALEKERSERYADAHEMVRDIESFVRSAGEYVGDRELSTYMRKLQGLPTPRMSQAASSVDAPEENAPPPSEPSTATSDDTFEGKPPELLKTPTAQLPPSETPDGAEIRTDTATVSAQGNGGGISTGLLAVFGVVILGILAAAGLIAYLLVLAPDDGGTTADDGPVASSDKTTKTKEKEKEKEKETEGILSHSNGLIVHISSTPSSEIWYDGERVGKTPFQTRLRPGNYEIELHGESGEKTETVQVKPGKPIQRFKFEM